MLSWLDVQVPVLENPEPALSTTTVAWAEVAVLEGVGVLVAVKVRVAVRVTVRVGVAV